MRRKGARPAFSRVSRRKKRRKKLNCSFRHYPQQEKKEKKHISGLCPFLASFRTEKEKEKKRGTCCRNRSPGGKKNGQQRPSHSFGKGREKGKKDARLPAAVKRDDGLSNKKRGKKGVRAAVPFGYSLTSISGEGQMREKVLHLLLCNRRVRPRGGKGRVGNTFLEGGEGLSWIPI